YSDSLSGLIDLAHYGALHSVNRVMTYHHGWQAGLEQKMRKPPTVSKQTLNPGRQTRRTGAEKMLTKRIAKVHHNKVPDVGAIWICHVDDRHTSWRYGFASPCARRYRKFRVESYPGFRADKCAPFSDGHLVNIKALDNGWQTLVAAHWLEVI